MDGLKGRKVILTAARKADEIRTIIEKHGGIVIMRPTQITTLVHHERLCGQMETLLSGTYTWLMLTTGIGTEILWETASRLQAEDRFLAALKTAKIAVRGHKTLTYLKTLGVTADVLSADGTTNGLQRALTDTNLRGESVAVQLYGGAQPTLVPWLEECGADVMTLQPYDYECADESVMDTLLADLLGRKGDAIAFTSGSQVHFLMSYAKRQDVLEQVVEALNDVVPVAVGKVTAGALYDEGVNQVIVPEQERMGGMVVALAKYFEGKTSQ